MSEKVSPKRGRTMFSSSEEEVIGKFLISCWHKKLKVPQSLLYDALKKHADKYPRVSRAKDNRPSEFWRQRFFQRNPRVQEAYKSFKVSPSYKEYDVVSEQLLKSFVSDLACVDKPVMLQEDDESSDKDSDDSDKPLKPSRMDSAGSMKKVKKKRKSLDQRSSLIAPVSSESEGIVGKARKHKRSKTVDGRSSKDEKGKLKTNSPVSATKTGSGKGRGRKSLASGLKLSPNLFSTSKASSKPSTVNKIEPARSASPAPSGSKKQQKEALKKKPSVDSPTSSRRKCEVPHDAIPLEPVKFEVGANIEAMDGSKWYKSKIMEVDEEKQEVLIHFNGWGKRFDTIFPMSSTLIRGPTQIEKKVELIKFNVGDDVLSQWTDGSFYPGTIMSIKETGSYIVMYYDGLKKLVRPSLLKRMTEKDKDAAMKAAQTAYLQSLTPTPSVSSPRPVSTGSEDSSFRRYRTSANDRERRVAARKASDDGNGTPQQRKRRNKRKIEDTEGSPSSTSATPVRTPSPTQTEHFHAKQARLDKITGTLLDKAVTTTTQTAATVSTTTSSKKLKTKSVASVDSSQPRTATGSTVKDQMAKNDTNYTEPSSDDSDSPLIIDEDGDSRSESKSVKSRKTQSTSGSTNKRNRKGSIERNASTGPNAASIPRSDGEENLRQLADAALSQPLTIPSKRNELQTTAGGPGCKRQVASEALLQLAQSFSDSSDQPEAFEVAKKPEQSIEPAVLKNLPLGKRIEIGVDKVLKEDCSIAQASTELEVKAVELRDALMKIPKVSFAESEMALLNTSQENKIVNWIHDRTELGWGITNNHIAHRIKMFLTDASFHVIFDDSTAMNFPSTKWLNEFLNRHPEIFPGREKPLLRYRFDREGFESWLVRWLHMLRSCDVLPNAVYYCDETVWDINQKLLHNVKFVHETIPLSDIASSGNKITALMCIGADGSTLTPHHVFPDNSGDRAIPEKNRVSKNVAFSNHGVLNSKYFLQWLKNSFVKGVSPRKRPLALLVDTRLETIDFEVLKYAQDNQIILYRFLPQGAHFIQHPDQKLFGRLRMQWKKSLFGKFMKSHAGKKVSTLEFSENFKQELMKVATPSTIKMCFELAKLYTPVPEPIQEESHKEKKNKRKSSKPVAYIAEEDPSQPDHDQSKSGDASIKSPVEKPSTTTQTSVAPGEQILTAETESGTMSAESVAIQSEQTVEGGKVLKQPIKRMEIGKPVTVETTPPSEAHTTAEKPSPTVENAQSPTSTQEAPVPFIKSVYKKGEAVLAKWTDCKLYMATVLKKLEGDNYKIRYYDGFVKVVNSDFLRAWNGPTPIAPPALPASAKSSSSTPQVSPKQRSLSSDSKTKNLRAALSVKRRHSLNIDGKSRPRRTSEATAKAAQQTSRTRRSSHSISDIGVGTLQAERILYKVGDNVLCKWTDRRMYPATVIKHTDIDHYLVKYYDNRRKLVHHTWLSPWKPPQPAKPAEESDGRSENKEEKDTPLSTKQSASVVDAGSESHTSKQPQCSSVEPSTEQPGEDTALDSAESPNDKPKLRSSRESSAKTITDGDMADAVNEGVQFDQNTAGSDIGLGSVLEGDFQIGASVLARWTDCRSYPATILKKTEDDQFIVQYYDGMTRTLKRGMLKLWDPNAVPQSKAQRRSREKKSDGGNQNVIVGTSKMDENQVSAPKSMGGKPALSAMKPIKVSCTYEAYYSKLTQDSELNKFKCRVPGCNKVFRRESVLKQHHKHYHLQRYKLRDQEFAPTQKRKASREDSGSSKRRVSADYYSTTSLSPKSMEATSPLGERPRTGGGKPPLDIYRMQQGADTSLLSSQGDEASSPEDQSALLTDDVRKGEPFVVLEKAALTSKNRRARNSSGGSRQSHDSASDAKELNGFPSSTADAAKNVEVVNEDVIRCVCREEEEDGFMLQCDACLTWQHAICEGINPPESQDEQEHKTPPDYICKICREPPGVRESQKYLYNNDFMSKGTLPKLVDAESSRSKKADEAENEKRFQHIMLATHQLMSELMKMQESVHGIRLKIDIANPGKNHPLLQLWKETNLADGANSGFIDSKFPNTRDSKELEGGPSAPNAEAGTSSNVETERGNTEPDEQSKSTNDVISSIVESLIMKTAKAVSTFSEHDGDEVAGDCGSKSLDATENRKEIADNCGKDEKMDVDVEEKSSAENAEVSSRDKIDSTQTPFDFESEKSDKKESASTSKNGNGDLWNPIKVVRDRRVVQQGSSRRNRSKSEDPQEEIVLRCRGNLLQHIHQLENCLSERLDQLEDYVTTLESSFEGYARPSPPPDGHSSHGHRDRSMELQSELGTMHEDIGTVHELLSAPSVSN